MKRTKAKRVSRAPSTQGMPTVQELYRPLARALKALGGSGSVDEMDAKTVELLGLPDSIANVLQNPENDTRTVV